MVMITIDYRLVYQSVHQLANQWVHNLQKPRQFVGPQLAIVALVIFQLVCCYVHRGIQCLHLILSHYLLFIESDRIMAFNVRVIQ